MKKDINPMFKSKVQYAPKVFVNPTSQICKDKEEDVMIKKLQVLHNMAMRAAPGIGGKDQQDFLQQTPQLDMPDICWRDVPEGCFTVSKNPYRHRDRSRGKICHKQVVV
jgi:hypothetical protein